MKTNLILILWSVVANAVPRNPQRIVGGTETTINQYPYGAAMLHSRNTAMYWQACGGGIISSNAVLSVGHCYHGDTPNRWRIRVGSTYANSGGTVHTISTIHVHPNYNAWTLDNDIAVIRTSINIRFIHNVVAQASLAGRNYHVPDNQPVWAIGWGLTSYLGSPSEQLRHVQVWTINQNTCRNRIAELGYGVTDNMFCTGWLDVGGRGQCHGDSGSPVVHYATTGVAVIVGVCSWGIDCETAFYGSVSVRVSLYPDWIVEKATTNYTLPTEANDKR